jgi:hypothetical protein
MSGPSLLDRSSAVIDLNSFSRLYRPPVPDVSRPDKLGPTSRASQSSFHSPRRLQAGLTSKDGPMKGWETRADEEEENKRGLIEIGADAATL